MTVLATFKRRNQVPPGGAWFFVVKETGAYFESRESRQDLEQQVRAHLSANGLAAPDNLWGVIEDYICRNSPEGFCDNQSESKPRMDYFSVLQFSEVLFNKIRAFARGEEFLVSKDEADARAKVCIGCPLNARHFCVSCTGLRETLAKFVANRRSKFDGWLGVCKVCGCVLASKIHVKKKFLATSEQQLQEVPENCWLRKEQ